MSDNLVALRPITSPEPPRRPIAVLDIETHGLGGEFICGAYTTEGDDRVHHFDSIAALMKVITSHKFRQYVWYAHNGGEYDYMYLKDALLELVIHKGAVVTPMVRAHTQIIGYIIRYDKHVIHLRDSMALLNSPLSDLADQFAPDYPKLEIGLSSGTVFDPANEEHRRYLEADVLSLKYILMRFDDVLVDAFGIHMQYSASSTALRAFQRTLDRIHIKQRPYVDAFAREGYFGGMTYMRTTERKENIWALDINAMYATVMRQGVPIGKPFGTDRYYPGLPGFYRVKAHAPKRVPMAILGSKEERGEVRWRKGHFRTVITNLEYEAAIRLGYDLVVEEGYVWPEIGYPFNPFIDQCEELERTYKGTPLAYATKVLRNSLYGRFAMKPEQEQYILAEEEPEDYQPVRNPYTGEYIDNLFFRDTLIDKPFMIPHWAAWITANARLLMVHYNEALGWQSIIYGDTDSIHIDADEAAQAIVDGRITVGTAYGDFKVAATYAWFQATSPKQYAAMSMDGAEVARAKGIPKRSLTFSDTERAAREKVTVEYQRLTSALDVLKGEPIGTTPASRSYGNLDTSTRWHRLPDGRVEAHYIAGDGP